MGPIRCLFELSLDDFELSLSGDGIAADQPLPEFASWQQGSLRLRFGDGSSKNVAISGPPHIETLPEPASGLMSGAGLLAIAFVRRGAGRHRARAA